MPQYKINTCECLCKSWCTGDRTVLRLKKYFISGSLNYESFYIYTLQWFHETVREIIFKYRFKDEKTATEQGNKYSLSLKYLRRKKQITELIPPHCWLLCSTLIILLNFRIHFSSYTWTCSYDTKLNILVHAKYYAILHWERINRKLWRSSNHMFTYDVQQVKKFNVCSVFLIGVSGKEFHLCIILHDLSPWDSRLTYEQWY